MLSIDMRTYIAALFSSCPTILVKWLRIQLCTIAISLSKSMCPTGLS